MESIFRTFKTSLRALSRQPGLFAGVVTLLALGIGSSTAIFTLVNATLLASLPYPDAERLVRLATYDRAKDLNGRVSYPDFEDWRSRARSFDAVAAAGNMRLTVTGGPGAESLIGQYVSSDYFDILGGVPTSGRLFDQAETDTRGPVRPVALVSQSYWQRRFGADPWAPGKSLTTTVGAFEVIGVIPPDFVSLLDRSDFWIPASASSLVYPGWVQDRKRRWHHVVGRLKAGVSRATAEAEMSHLGEQLATAFPASNAGLGVRLQGIEDSFRDRVRPGLFLLLAGALFLQAIACTNVAHLMLVRSQGRRTELAIRAALGSSRRRTMGLVLTESVLLALAGGGLGLLVAAGLSRFLAGLGAMDLPRYVHPGLDWTVFWAALGLSLASSVGFGLLPALIASKSDLVEALKAGARGTLSRGAGRFTRTMSVVQIAVSLTLLVGAGLMIASFEKLRNFDPGFRPDHLVALEINPRGPRYEDPAAQRALARALDERLKTLPGMETAIVAPHLPPRLFWPLDLQVEGRAAEEATRVEMHSVSTEFFDVLGIPLRAGRLFNQDDQPGSPKTVVVSTALARSLWPGHEAVGKRVRSADAPLESDWLTVVGVVGDVKYDGMRSPRGPEFDVYFPLEQSPATYFTVAARSAQETGAIVASIRRELQSLDSELPILEVSTVPERLARQSAGTKLQAAILGLFALAAFALAVAGLYSTISYSLSRRSREMGIRGAIGATPRELARMIVLEGATLALGGVALGTATSLFLTRMLEALLFGVSTTDPATILVAATVIGIASVLACAIPARRAANVDPMTVLRTE